MSAWRPDASKVALVGLVDRVRAWGFRFIDAQVPTPHTTAMGAEQWPRARFLDALREELRHPTRKGNWASEPALEPPAG
jgi:leucyl/phenylalanyl-tRNA--protein transferase